MNAHEGHDSDDADRTAAKVGSDVAAGTAATELNIAGSRGPSLSAPLVEYLLRLGDDRLILGHRLSEWTGHGPILEEDIALSNLALDLVGQASMFLGLAGEVEGSGRDADALAFFREGVQFRNAQIVELPRGDFGFTMMRQFLFDAYSVLLLEVLAECGHAELAAIASKSLKEVTYHLRHSSEWIVRLGDGTDESHSRVQQSLNELWRYTGELFESDAIDAAVAVDGISIDKSVLHSRWSELVHDVLTRATLSVPADEVMVSGGRRGLHTEHLGHLLSVMQSVARAHPGASW